MYEMYLNIEKTHNISRLYVFCKYILYMYENYGKLNIHLKGHLSRIKRLKSRVTFYLQKHYMDYGL